MNENYPLLRARVQSSVIDLVFIIILMYLFTHLFAFFENVPDEVRLGAFLFLFVGYEPICTALGATLGHYLSRIRVRKFSDTSQRINFLQSCIRYPIKVALGMYAYLSISRNPQRRAIHDLAAGSVMIKV